MPKLKETNPNTTLDTQHKITKTLHALRMLPPDLQGDPEDETALPRAFLFFNDTQNKRRQVPCTLKVYKRVTGVQRRGQPPAGMSMLGSDVEFRICLDAKGVCVRVDEIHLKPRLQHKVKVEDEKNEGKIFITMDQATKSYTVTDMPRGTTRKTITGLLNLFDSQEVIEPGLQLSNKFVVDSVAGNKIEIQVVEDEV